MIIAGVLISFILMAIAGVYAVKKVSSTEDFVVAGKSSSAVMVAGTILGACIGAGSTIGTAETAFKLGIVGWWQTLGLGIGCLVLSLGLSQAIYKMTEAETIPQIIATKFGQRIVPVTAIFSSIAIFFSILSQTKGFIPLMTSIIPVSIPVAALICVVLVLIFVVFGGIFSTSLGGVIKMVLVLLAMIISAVIAFKGFGSFGVIKSSFDPSFFNLFARGPQRDIAIGLGYVLGVLVTQTYVQAVLSAKDAKAARNGAMLGALLTIPMGLFGFIVGLYMRANFPDMVAAQALPKFMIMHYNPIIAGIFIGALMLCALGSNAGLTLGISTLISRDVINNVRKPKSDREELFTVRLIMIIVVCLSAVFAVTKAGELIQTFIFLSFGMRTTVFLVPLLYTLFYKGQVTQQAGMASVICGPVVNIIFNLVPGLKVAFDPIFAGLIASFLAFVIVNAATKNKPIKGVSIDE